MGACRSNASYRSWRLVEFGVLSCFSNASGNGSVPSEGVLQVLVACYEGLNAPHSRETA